MCDEGHCNAFAVCIGHCKSLASCALQSAFLSGKWTLVTGSSRGIGLAVAEAFSREGAKVIITCEEGQKEDLQKVGPLAATHNGFFLSVNRFFCGMPVWLQVLFTVTAQLCSALCDSVQAEESCKKYGAAEVKSIIADLTDAKEAQRLGEVCPLALSAVHGYQHQFVGMSCERDEDK